MRWFWKADVCEIYQMPKALAKYRKDAKVVPKVTKRTLVVGLVRRERASFFKQLAHWKSRQSGQTRQKVEGYKRKAYVPSPRRVREYTCQSRTG